MCTCVRAYVSVFFSVSLFQISSFSRFDKKYIHNLNRLLSGQWCVKGCPQNFERSACNSCLIHYDYKILNVP